MQDENQQTGEANPEPQEAATVAEATPAQAEEQQQPQAAPHGRGPRGGRGGGGGRGRGGGDNRGGGRGRRDDRRGGRGGDDDGGEEVVEKLVHINRVSKTVKGGKRFGFAALVVGCDGKGPAGLGHWQARQDPEVTTKATPPPNKAT